MCVGVSFTSSVTLPLLGLSVRFGVGRHLDPSKVVASSRIAAMTPDILNVESFGLHSMSDQTALSS